MPLLVVGSVALDTVETPQARRENVLGGSAVYFSYAASFFAPVRLVGTVGEDWPAEHTALLANRQIDTRGLQVEAGGKTFRWTGRYRPNMNDRDTLEVHLNVFERFNPTLTGDFRRCSFLFLGNASPSTQLRVLEQVEGRILAVADTMDLWINIQRDELLALLKRVDGLVLNDSEAKLLADDDNLVRAGKYVLSLGPKFVVVKKGEHGAMFFSQEETFVLPAFPTEAVCDPTGAGDCFAGGLMGYLAQQRSVTQQSLKRALAYGTVVASYCIEDFSLDRLRQIERGDLDARYAQYRQMMAI